MSQHPMTSTPDSPQGGSYDGAKGGSSPSKTPISSLQEWCQRLGKTPQYDLTAMEGRAHQPQFVYRCTVGDITKTGQGGSKKAAKHAAAEAVLHALQSGGTMEEDLSYQEHVPEPVKAEPVAPMESDKQEESISSNPVGALQELVVARGWRLPVYSMYAESGPAHKKEFIMCCTVESFKEYGSGTAKKHAKRTAATKMYNKILSLPPDAEPSHDEEKTKTKAVSFDLLRNSQGNIIRPMTVENLSNNNVCQSLAKIAECTSFSVEYHDIGRMTESGVFQCLALLTTQPGLVVHGMGSTMHESHKNAAINALNMLNILLQRNARRNETKKDFTDD